MIGDPAIRARGVEIDVRGEIGGHERFSEEARAEVRDDDRESRIRCGDRVKRKGIAKTNVEPAGEPQFLSHPDGQHATVDEHRAAPSVGSSDLEDLQRPLIVEPVAMHGRKQADASKPQATERVFRPPLSILARWVQHERADEPMRVSRHRHRDGTLVTWNTGHESRPRHRVLVQLRNPTVREVSPVRRVVPSLASESLHWLGLLVRGRSCHSASVSKNRLEKK